MCINLGIGLVTPPVGTILYIMAGITKEPLDKLIPSFVPYIIVMVIGLVLLLLFPPLTTFLPGLFLGKAGLR
jgi:TRAP-type C4-dicarboxylate transport system permease large subunit